ncbi:MAG: hypothetical protein OHK0039_21320 [Bacteroidia bacterium]
MKPTTGILALVWALHLLSPVLLIGWYGLNSEAVAARYCVNRSRPQLHCDGKCYLAQQLQRHTPTGQQPSRVYFGEVIGLCTAILQAIATPWLPGDGGSQRPLLSERVVYAVYLQASTQPPDEA